MRRSAAQPVYAKSPMDLSFALLGAVDHNESSHARSSGSLFQRGGAFGRVDESTSSRALRLVSILARA